MSFGPILRPGRDPEAAAKKLRRRFQAVSRGDIWRLRRRRWRLLILGSIFAGAIGYAAVSLVLKFSLISL